MNLNRVIEVLKATENLTCIEVSDSSVSIPGYGVDIEHIDGGYVLTEYTQDENGEYYTNQETLVLADLIEWIEWFDGLFD